MKWSAGGLAGALVLAGLFHLSPAAAVSPPAEALLGFFPAETDGVFFVDVADLRRHPLFADLTAGDLPAPLEDFARSTGLDPRRDVEHVMLGSVAGAGLTVARAQYDASAVRDRFAGLGVVAEPYRGHDVYRPEPPEDGAVAFLGPYVVLGPDVLLRAALDRSAGGEGGALDNALLLEGLRAIEEGSQVWAAGIFQPSLLPDGMAPPMALDLMGALRQGAYQMRFDDAVTTRAVGAFDTPASAERTADLLRGLMTLGRMHAASQSPDLLELLDGVQIRNTEAEVRIDSVADPALFRRIAANGIALPLPQ